jgi:hypothetical protein
MKNIETTKKGLSFNFIYLLFVFDLIIKNFEIHNNLIPVPLMS